MDNPYVDNWVLTGIYGNAFMAEDSVGCCCMIMLVEEVNF